MAWETWETGSQHCSPHPNSLPSSFPQFCFPSKFWFTLASCLVPLLSFSFPPSEASFCMFPWEICQPPGLSGGKSVRAWPLAAPAPGEAKGMWAELRMLGQGVSKGVSPTTEPDILKHWQTDSTTVQRHTEQQIQWSTLFSHFWKHKTVRGEDAASVSLKVKFGWVPVGQKEKQKSEGD